jgi:RNA recognition motif-containing protein
MSKLFVGGLAWATTEESMREHFEACGDVVDVKIITDRESGRSRGFGFVTYGDGDGASAALDSLNGSDLDGRSIRVEAATERSGGGGGGGGGGRRGGGGGGGGNRW